MSGVPENCYGWQNGPPERQRCLDCDDLTRGECAECGLPLCERCRLVLDGFCAECDARIQDDKKDAAEDARAMAAEEASERDRDYRAYHGDEAPVRPRSEA